MSTVSGVTQLDDYRPHFTAMVECGYCHHKWAAAYLATTDQLQCPHCYEFVDVSDSK
jgi:hypothetical protein